MPSLDNRAPIGVPLALEGPEDLGVRLAEAGQGRAEAEALEGLRRLAAPAASGGEAPGAEGESSKIRQVEPAPASGDEASGGIVSASSTTRTSTIGVRTSRLWIMLATSTLVRMSLGR